VGEAMATETGYSWALRHHDAVSESRGDFKSYLRSEPPIPGDGEQTDSQNF